MARRSPAPAVDRLYQVPLNEFIAERNALAKSAGPDGAEIRALQKPTLPAWAINQLYWQQRDIYDQLIDAAADIRATHNAALRGQRADLRGAGKAHDDAIERAFKAILTLLADSGHPVTDATRQAIQTTLRALPSEEPPGRLSRQLEPRGFEVLGVAAPAGRVKAAPPPAKPKAPRPPATGGAEDRKAQAARLAAARDAVTAASRATRDAEQVARREEFEAARAAREAEKAQRRLDAAEEALRQAQAEAGEARETAEKSGKVRDEAQARADKALDQLAEARDVEERARKDLERGKES
ncbi:MAG: hypothetical protein ACRD1U_18905 [Vicinamibacterales bacterium]